MPRLPEQQIVAGSKSKISLLLLPLLFSANPAMAIDVEDASLTQSVIYVPVPAAAKNPVLLGVGNVKLFLKAQQQPLNFVAQPDPSFPPDPGLAGLATVAGVDYDGDGVRDDIERYIALKFPAASQKNIRLGLYRYARTFQSLVPNSAPWEFKKKHDVAFDCMYSQTTIGLEAMSEATGDLHDHFFNTYDRLLLLIYRSADAKGYGFARTTTNLNTECAL